MLLECFKNSKEEQEVNSKWFSWRHKNGHKDVTINNFLKLDYAFCSYVVDGVSRSGFFPQEDIDFIFKVLEYHNGKIKALNG